MFDDFFNDTFCNDSNEKDWEKNAMKWKLKELIIFTLDIITGDKAYFVPHKVNIKYGTIWMWAWTIKTPADILVPYQWLIYV